MSNKYQKFNPELYQKVMDYISTYTIDPCRYLSTRLQEQLGVDSLTMTIFVIGLEEEFGIFFEDADLDPSKIRTVGDVVKLVFFYRCGYTEEEIKDAAMGDN